MVPWGPRGVPWDPEDPLAFGTWALGTRWPLGTQALGPRALGPAYSIWETKFHYLNILGYLSGLEG